MNKLYEALEICLNEIEKGADVDTVLFRYPELANELRPILEASVKAKDMAAPVPSQDVIRRNRAKLLQHAAEMRERKAAPVSRRIWSVPLRRALVTLMVVAMLFVSGTGLVRASSATLPGDNLYPVKRTWEDLLLLFTFDADKREVLELEHENERLEELHELFTEGRSAEVDFAGYVTRQSGSEWLVSDITVFVLPGTVMPDRQVLVGAAVRVHGRIQNGGVAATQINLLPSGYKLPEVKGDELEVEGEEHEGSSPQIEEVSGSGSENEAPEVPEIATSAPEFEPEDESFEGVVTSVENDFIVVNGTIMDIRFAEIERTPYIGAVVKVEGYFDLAGIFVVTKIEFRDGGLNEEESNSNDVDDNSNDLNENDNDNYNGVDDDNENDNDNDN
ncbi:MAG TPA: DUF5667 domain-containing protein [Anaerolineales bacterium]|nr:DUF5667 domain-containing protein [Anaerolineales bacterium]